MHISRRLSRVKPSATLAVSAKAMELKAAGKEIISLAVGEPDFPSPGFMKDAVKKALDDNFTRYTQVPGIPELRKAVAGYFKRHYKVEAPMEATIVTNGGKQALYNIFQAILDPGDEVIIPAPYWVSYPDMVALADGVPVFLPTEPERDFKCNVKDIEAVATPQTRALILNSPSNPTGCHYSQAELETIAAFAASRGILVISDEIYDRLVYPPAEPASLSPMWEKHPEHIVVVNGLAKSFAATGWRVGYALAHPDLIKAMNRLQDQSTSCICSFVQKGALAALESDMALVDEMRKAYHRRRDLVLERVRNWPGIACPVPDGAFYLFPRMDSCYTKEINDSEALCTMLLERAGVALVPGAAFGDDRCIRISYAVSEETLDKAMQRIGEVLF